MEGRLKTNILDKWNTLGSQDDKDAIPCFIFDSEVISVPDEANCPLKEEICTESSTFFEGLFGQNNLSPPEKKL